IGLLAAALTAFAASTAQADLFVSSISLGTVLQYDETAGGFLADFGGELTPDPRMVLRGPDGNFYVASNGKGAIVQFDNLGNLLNASFAQKPAGGLHGQR